MEGWVDLGYAYPAMHRLESNSRPFDRKSDVQTTTPPSYPKNNNFHNVQSTMLCRHFSKELSNRGLRVKGGVITGGVIFTVGGIRWSLNAVYLLGRFTSQWNDVSALPRPGHQSVSRRSSLIDGKHTGPVSWKMRGIMATLACKLSTSWTGRIFITNTRSHRPTQNYVHCHSSISHSLSSAA